jgi:hypothetical protein
MEVIERDVEEFKRLVDGLNVEGKTMLMTFMAFLPKQGRLKRNCVNLDSRRREGRKPGRRQLK